MGSPIEDIEFLAGSAYRANALRELTHEPCDRDTLRAVTGASKATIGRMLNELEERNWIERDGYVYRLTDPGRVVGEAFLALVDTVETEQSLREVWQYLPHDLPGFTISHFTDAVVAFTEPGTPYQPIPRTMELIEATRTMRMFSKRIPKTETLTGITRNAAEGMETVLVFPPGVVQEIPTAVATVVIERAVEDGRLAIFEHDAFPTDTTFVLYDDRIGLYCRDELGVTRLSIDTDNPEAVAWVEGVYEEVLRAARPVDLLNLVR